MNLQLRPDLAGRARLTPREAWGITERMAGGWSRWELSRHVTLLMQAQEVSMWSLKVLFPAWWPQSDWPSSMAVSFSRVSAPRHPG